MDEETRYKQGLQARRQVLGEAHVDRSLQHQTDFNRPFQEFITRYAWGDIWSRPGLSRYTRSIVTLALMVSLNREEEFRMHVRAALTNGVSPGEIQETLLHTAIYCGLPAANSAFRWAEEALSQMKDDNE